MEYELVTGIVLLVCVAIGYLAFRRRRSRNTGGGGHSRGPGRNLPK